MIDLATPYAHLQGVLTTEDVRFLAAASERQLLTEGIPCYTLLDELTSPTFLKIKDVVERCVGEPVYYLNDFYIYTDESSATRWHMDTELFTFANAVNAWILLSPGRIVDPLSFMSGVNESTERFYHSVSVEDGECIFAEYVNGNSEVRALADVEAEKIHTPAIDVGDVLVINPQRFHKTNVSTPKHSFAIKFVTRGPKGFLSDMQVPADFWAEVAIFNRLLETARGWDEVIEGVRHALRTEDGKKELSAGFYPEKFELYRAMASSLAAEPSSLVARAV